MDGQLEELLGLGDGVLQDLAGENMQGIAIEGRRLVTVTLFLGAEAAGDDVGGFDGGAALVGKSRAEHDGRRSGNGAGGLGGAAFDGVVERDEDLDDGVAQELFVGRKFQSGG